MKNRTGEHLGSAQEAGPQEQFARHFEDCRPNLLRICLRILGEPGRAQDAVSDTYLRAYANLGRFEATNFAGWLSRIAQRICLDRLRADRPTEPIDEHDDLTAGYNEMRLLTAIQIRTILAKLPEAQRRCLKLFYIEGFSAKEVAQETGFTEKQVKSHLQNGRRNFTLQWESLKKKSHE